MNEIVKHTTNLFTSVYSYDSIHILQVHAGAKIGMFDFSPHLLYQLLPACVHRQSCTLALYRALRTPLSERASARALSDAGGEP